MRQFFHYYPFIGIALLLIAISYMVMKERKVNGSSGYPRFFFVSISSYFAVMFLFQTVLFLRNSWFILNNALYVFGLMYWITILHVIYPFDKGRKNRYFLMTSLFVCGFILLLILAVWLSVYMFGM